MNWFSKNEQSTKPDAAPPSSSVASETLSTNTSTQTTRSTTNDFNKIEDDQIDTFVAKALSRLSVQEREKVYQEVHGVDDLIEENPSFVSEKLVDLDGVLRTVKQRHSKARAIQLAESISAQHVQDPLLRLKFLRAESFNTRKAADRMINFFDLKLFLFGKEKLCKGITLADLSSDDLATLKAGFMQLLPVRDRAGRAIFILVPTFETYKYAENMTRAMYYIIMSALEDEETQRRGITIIIYNSGKFVEGKTDLKTVSQGCWVEASLPVKSCSLHHCYNDAGFRFIVNISVHFFGEKARARIKMHPGTHVECVYALMTYGIPPDALPITMDGELKRKSHQEWMKMRKQQENSFGPRIVVPTHRDVLYGRGKPFREHMGNMRLFNLLDEKLAHYDSLKLKKEKTKLISEMVNIIKAEKGRFLKQEGCMWEEVDDKMAKEKVSHAFRTRLRLAPNETQQEVRSVSVRPHLQTAQMLVDDPDVILIKRPRMSPDRESI